MHGESREVHHESGSAPGPPGGKGGRRQVLGVSRESPTSTKLACGRLGTAADHVPAACALRAVEGWALEAGRALHVEDAAVGELAAACVV